MSAPGEIAGAKAADAEDAKRYRWLKTRLFAADADYMGEWVIVFKMPKGSRVSMNVDETVDAAMTQTGQFTSEAEWLKHEGSK